MNVGWRELAVESILEKIDRIDSLLLPSFDFTSITGVSDLSQTVVDLLSLLWKLPDDRRFEPRAELVVPPREMRRQPNIDEAQFCAHLERAVLSRYESVSEVADNPLIIENSWSAFEELHHVGQYASICLTEGDVEGALASVSFFFWVLHGGELIDFLRVLWSLNRDILSERD